VIVKLFIPNENEEDDHAELRMESILKPYRDATFLVQCRFSGVIHPNVVPYESSEILNKSAILVRQFFGRNLYDRLYSNPHLTSVHQQWFAVQILLAVAQLHSIGLIHGDIKSENVFIVGSFHAILTDLSTFIKPVYLPLNDPVAATSMFFESGVKRRRCFVAPERFNEKLTSRVLDEHGRRMTFFDKEFTTDFMKMDLFSTGLTIAEMVLEGQHVIDLPELLSFRSGQFSLSSVLEKIPDPTIRSLVEQLTQLNPANRPVSAVSCLGPLVAPFASLMLPLMTLSSHPIYANADMRMMLVRANWGYIESVLTSGSSTITSYDPFTELEIFDQCVSSSLISRGVSSSIQPLIDWAGEVRSKKIASFLFPHPVFSRNACMQFTTQLLALWQEGMEAHTEGRGDAWRGDSMTQKTNELYNIFFTNFSKNDEPTNPNPALLPLLASFLGNTVMACNCARSKIVYLDMVSAILAETSKQKSSWTTDYILPYVHDLASGASDWKVRARAMGVIGELVGIMESAETGLFSEYLFPLCLVPNPPESLSDSILRLAVDLVTAATRLSLPDPGGKRLEAIRMFADRVVEVGLSRGWKRAISKNLQIFKNSTQNFQQCMYEFAPDELMDDLAVVCDVVSSTDLREIVLSHVIPVLTSGIGQHVAAISGLNKLLSHPQCPLPLPTAIVVSIAESVIPQLLAPRDVFSKIAIEQLVNTFSRIVSAVDQFVFLRHLFPEGCYSLLDLIGRSGPDGWNPKNSNIPPSSVTPIEPSQHSPNHSHSFSVQLVNPTVGQLGIPPLVKAQLDAGGPTSLGSFRDWRIESLGFPSHAFPADLGCLSNAEGSLVSLYDGNGVGMHRRFLNTLPGVPEVAVGGAGVTSMFSSHLATLTDFSTAGVAVPVVAVDSTDDGRVIIGGGADGSVRVWRVSALETESVMQAARGFRIPNCGRLFKLKTVRNTKSIVVGNDDQLLMFRVDTSLGGGGGMMSSSISSSSGQSHPVMQSVKHAFGYVVGLETFDTDLASCVVAATESGHVVNWDFRAGNNFAWAKRLIDPNEFLAPISGMVVSKDTIGLAIATVNGYMSIFDMRFLKEPVRRFTTPNGISALTHSADPRSIWVSSGHDIGKFDIFPGGCAEWTFGTAAEKPNDNPFELRPYTHGPPSEWNIQKMNKAFPGNARCVMECADSGSWTLLSGHNDAVARYWTSSGEGGIACPAQPEPLGIVTVREKYLVQPLVRENDRTPLSVTEGHRDVINDMCLANLQYDILVTAGRDGLVKLWR
jgi:serine/threonine protein kinase